MQFKCSSCGHKFEANENDNVLCPNCSSDNVGPCKPSPLKVILPLIGVLVIAAVTFFVIQNLKNKKADNPAEPSTEQKDVVTETLVNKAEEEPKVKEEKVIVEPIAMAVSTPVLRKGKYSFAASSQNVPEGVKIKYVLMNSLGSKIVMESENGEFVSVPPSKEKGGMYMVAVENAETNQILCSRVIGGMIVEEVIVKKMSKDELESMINSSSNDLLTVHPRISKKVEFIFDNLEAEEKKPSTFDGIFEKFIMQDWESVLVTNVVYEKSGKISKISMHIKHIEF